MIDVEEFTTNDAAGTAPNITAVAPVKLVPVMATDVPPPVLPLVVPRLLTPGADAVV